MGRRQAGATVRLFGTALSVMAVAASSAAYGQEPPAEGVPSVTPEATPPPAVAPPAPPAPPPPSPPVTAGRAEPAPAVERVTTDFDPEVRRWAVGYAGLSQVPVGGPSVQDITVPAIGIRYWANQTVGVDFAVGIGWSGGSTKSGGVSTDKDSVTGFIVQGGLPFALSTHRHVSFQLMPFVALAHGQASTGSGVNQMDFSGTRVDVGARVGFELFFGFIGIPELALNATIGMQFESRKYSLDSNGFSQSDTTLGFSTTVQNNPWDIFAGNVAARYYF